jgi:carboxyl-terminal processing protease
MVAIAVKDAKAGTLIGQQTFGKGSIQSFYELSDGGALKLTTANFKGPKGTIVNKVGISPDKIVIAGKEVSVAHYANLENQLNIKLYKKTTTLEQVPTNKAFTIKFSQPMKFSEDDSLPRIELVKMGGQVQPISRKIKDEYSLIVTPKQLLEKDETYLLIVHPQFSNQKGVVMRKGSYTMVTVKIN